MPRALCRCSSPYNSLTRLRHPDPEASVTARWLALALGGVCMCSAFAEPIKYPDTRREDLEEKLHGTVVPDPYRWLEEDVRKSPEVKAWVEPQNKSTSATLAATPSASASRSASPSCGTTRS